jgi:cytochrome c-type biogenesis protein CcmE
MQRRLSLYCCFFLALFALISFVFGALRTTARYFCFKHGKQQPKK